MKKLIKLEFNNTTQERKTEDSFSELYSYDKNNGSFEFEILNDTLTTEQVTALFKFTESNKIWKTTGTVEGNKVKVTFDTTLITQNETVICYLYFDEEQRTSDTFRFKFKVKVSEIDKMNRYEVKERFINNTVIVDRLDVVTKDELKEALKNVGGIATEGLLTEAKAEETYAKKSEAVDNTNFELVKNRVLALELKTDKDTVYDDSELKGRVSVLEAKHDNDTVYDDTNVRERLTALESKPNIDVSNLATKEELEAVRGSQPSIDNLVTKDELASKNYISDISNLATKQELNEVRNSQSTVDTSNLVTRDELTAKNYVTDELLESKGYLKSHQSLENLVTKQELEEKQYLTAHQDLSEYAKKSELYNDSDLKARVEVLEQKTDKDTVYDDTPLKERVTALESKAIEGGAYDDSDLRNRVVALESKEDKDTKYDDTDLRNRVTNLENKPPLDTSEFVTNQALESKGYIKDVSNLVTKDELENKHFLTEHQNLSSLVTKQELENKGYLTSHQPLDNLVTKEELNSKGYLISHQPLTDYAKKSELYNDTEVKQRLTTLESKPAQTLTIENGNISISGGNSVALPVNRYEIHGTGMPNGVVEAEIGTTYIDKNKTNGAFKWIKTTDGGNQGWEVLTGDTGWRTLNSVSKLGNSFVKIRRVNNEVTYQFGGLSYGWFGIVRRGGAGYSAQVTDLERNCFILWSEQIPEGFRTPNSLIGSIFNDRGVAYGTWYVGNALDKNHLRFQFLNPVPTDRDIGDIRVSTISYFTNEPWPTQLP